MPYSTTGNKLKLVCSVTFFLGYFFFKGWQDGKISHKRKIGWEFYENRVFFGHEKIWESRIIFLPLQLDPPLA